MLIINSEEKKKYRREYMKKYREKNKTKINQQRKKWDNSYYQSHKNEISAKRKEGYKTNPDPCKERAREYYWNNQDVIKAYRENNKERRNKQKREWYRDNIDHVASYRKKYYMENADILQTYATNYYLQNRKRIIESSRRWREANPDKVLDQWRRKHDRRRARLFNRKVEHIDRAEVYERDNGLCGICGERVSWDEITIDHIIPIARGGDHVYSNVQIAHRVCNSIKGSKTPEELEEWIAKTKALEVLKK